MFEDNIAISEDIDVDIQPPPEGTDDSIMDFYTLSDFSQQMKLANVAQHVYKHFYTSS